MAKVKKITIEFYDGTARELTRRQFIAIIRGTAYGVAREVLEIPILGM